MASNSPKDTDETTADEGGFQVRDRRASQAEETPTSNTDAPEGTEETPSDEPAPAIEEPTAAESPPPSRFARFVASLHMTALYHLGLIPGPQGEKPTPNLAMARENIDILLELKEKTHGNLTESETALMAQAVQDLQHHFMQAVMSGTAGDSTQGDGSGS